VLKEVGDGISMF